MAGRRPLSGLCQGQRKRSEGKSNNRRRRNRPGEKKIGLQPFGSGLSRVASRKKVSSKPLIGRMVKSSPHGMAKMWGKHRPLGSHGLLSERDLSRLHAHCSNLNKTPAHLPDRHDPIISHASCPLRSLQFVGAPIVYQQHSRGAHSAGNQTFYTSCDGQLSLNIQSLPTASTGARVRGADTEGRDERCRTSHCASRHK